MTKSSEMTSNHQPISYILQATIFLEVEDYFLKSYDPSESAYVRWVMRNGTEKRTSEQNKLFRRFSTIAQSVDVFYAEKTSKLCALNNEDSKSVISLCGGESQVAGEQFNLISYGNRLLKSPENKIRNMKFGLGKGNYLILHLSLKLFGEKDKIWKPPPTIRRCGSFEKLKDVVMGHPMIRRSLSWADLLDAKKVLKSVQINVRDSSEFLHTTSTFSEDRTVYVSIEQEPTEKGVLEETSSIKPQSKNLSRHCSDGARPLTEFHSHKKHHSDPNSLKHGGPAISESGEESGRAKSRMGNSFSESRLGSIFRDQCLSSSSEKSTKTSKEAVQLRSAEKKHDSPQYCTAEDIPSLEESVGSLLQSVHELNKQIDEMENVIQKAAICVSRVEMDFRILDQDLIALQKEELDVCKELVNKEFSRSVGRSVHAMQLEHMRFLDEEQKHHIAAYKRQIENIDQALNCPAKFIQNQKKHPDTESRSDQGEAMPRSENELSKALLDILWGMEIRNAKDEEELRTMEASNSEIRELLEAFEIKFCKK